MMPNTKKVPKRKIIPQHFLKKSNRSNTSLSQLLVTASYKKKIRDLVRNNRNLAQAVQHYRLESASQASLLKDYSRDGNNIMLARDKLKSIAKAISGVVEDLAEVMNYLDINWAFHNVKLTKDRSPSNDRLKIKVPSVSVIEEGPSALENDLSANSNPSPKSNSCVVDKEVHNEDIGITDESVIEHIENVPPLLFINENEDSGKRKNSSNTSNKSQKSRRQSSAHQSSTPKLDIEHPCAYRRSSSLFTGRKTRSSEKKLEIEPAISSSVEDLAEFNTNATNIQQKISLKKRRKSSVKSKRTPSPEQHCYKNCVSNDSNTTLIHSPAKVSPNVDINDEMVIEPIFNTWEKSVEVPPNVHSKEILNSLPVNSIETNTEVTLVKDIKHPTPVTEVNSVIDNNKTLFLYEDMELTDVVSSCIPVSQNNDSSIPNNISKSGTASNYVASENIVKKSASNNASSLEAVNKKKLSKQEKDKTKIIQLKENVKSNKKDKVINVGDNRDGEENTNKRVAEDKYGTENKNKGCAEDKNKGGAEDKNKGGAEDKIKGDAECKSKDKKIKDFADDKNKGAADDKNKGVADNKNKGVADDKNKGVADNKNKGVADDKNKGFADDKNKGVSDDKSKGVADDKSKGVADDKSKGCVENKNKSGEGNKSKAGIESKNKGGIEDKSKDNAKNKGSLKESKKVLQHQIIFSSDSTEIYDVNSYLDNSLQKIPDSRNENLEVCELGIKNNVISPSSTHSRSKKMLKSSVIFSDDSDEYDDDSIFARSGQERTTSIFKQKKSVSRKTSRSVGVSGTNSKSSLPDINKSERHSVFDFNLSNTETPNDKAKKQKKSTKKKNSANRETPKLISKKCTVTKLKGFDYKFSKETVEKNKSNINPDSSCSVSIDSLAINKTKNSLNESFKEIKEPMQVEIKSSSELDLSSLCLTPNSEAKRISFAATDLVCKFRKMSQSKTISLNKKENTVSKCLSELEQELALPSTNDNVCDLPNPDNEQLFNFSGETELYTIKLPLSLKHSLPKQINSPKKDVIHSEIKDLLNVSNESIVSDEINNYKVTPKKKKNSILKHSVQEKVSENANQTIAKPTESAEAHQDCESNKLKRTSIDDEDSLFNFSDETELYKLPLLYPLPKSVNSPKKDSKENKELPNLSIRTDVFAEIDNKATPEKNKLSERHLVHEQIRESTNQTIAKLTENAFQESESSKLKETDENNSQVPHNLDTKNIKHKNKTPASRKKNCKKDIKNLDTNQCSISHKTEKENVKYKISSKLSVKGKNKKIPNGLKSAESSPILKDILIQDQQHSNSVDGKNKKTPNHLQLTEFSPVSKDMLNLEHQISTHLEVKRKGKKAHSGLKSAESSPLKDVLNLELVMSTQPNDTDSTVLPKRRSKAVSYKEPPLNKKMRRE